MEQHTLEILEFNKIAENVSQYCFSQEGRNKLLQEKIEDNEAAWQEKIDAVFAIKKIFDNNLYFPSLSVPAIEETIEKIGIEGTVLDTGELDSFIVLLKASVELKKHLFSATGDNLLAGNALGINVIRSKISYVDTTDIINYLSRYVKNGVFRSENVKALCDIKAKISSVNKVINSSLSKYFSDPDAALFLQESTPTIRDNRTVLPLKENFKGKIKGIVHSASSRGMTLFVEPVELIEYNNEIAELEERYKIEVQKILRELTAKIREKAVEYFDIFKKMIFLDSIIARAKFAHFSKCILPEKLEKGIFLKNVKHFLLGEKSVPVDIILKDNIKGLIISGPNTGGKTLSLKTAGLSVLMNQFCLGVIADEGSALSFFVNVLADIGDEQSIACSLSTFSAHMKNISFIIKLSDEKTLVLLDEPGTGTDPEEGSSLSMAIFDCLIEKNTLFLATTHQVTLKNFAAGNEHLSNVSVAYNPSNFMPEYKLIYGLPGESLGIDIAEKNGIEKDVIQKAKQYIGSEKIDINKLLKEITLKQLEIEEKEKTLKNNENKIKEMRKIAALKELSLKQREFEVSNTERRAVNNLLKESRKKIENIVKNIIEKNADEQSKLEARNFIKDIESDLQEYDDRVQKIRDSAVKMLDFDFQQNFDNQADNEELLHDFAHNSGWLNAAAAKEKLVPGTEIFIGEKKQKGEVVRALKNGKYLVQTGAVKIEVELPAIFLQQRQNSEKKKQKPKKAEILLAELNNSGTPVFELDLRGDRVEHALEKLERQLDAALINNLTLFSVIHGTGEGALKNAVCEYLAASHFVKKFYFAHPDNGGFGKTVVEL